VGGVVPAIGDETVEDARAAFVTAIDGVTASDPWLTEHPPLLEWVPPSFEPSYTPRDHEFVQVACRALAGVLHTTPVIRPLLGGSDLRFYSRHFGIPGIHLGPGALRLGHGADETLAVAELIAATMAVAAIVLDWSGGKRP
jgi:acetylornithine deacetylase